MYYGLSLLLWCPCCVFEAYDRSRTGKRLGSDGSTLCGGSKHLCYARVPTRSVESMPDGNTTTLMLQGLPPNLKKRMLLQLLDAEGAGRYNLVYVPYDKIANRPMSWAIVNFTDQESASKVHGFFTMLQLETGWSLHVKPAKVQGLEANLALIVASSSQGFSILSQPFGPLMFEDGVQVATGPARLFLAWLTSSQVHCCPSDS